METTKKHIIILGGGVAGMSAAHELIERGFKVTVFEKQCEIPGGKARSIPIKETATPNSPPLPGEHGFRFFPGFYKHIIHTFKRIPTTKGKTVYDNLVECTDIMMTRTQKNALFLPSHFPRSFSDLKKIKASMLVVQNELDKGEPELIALKIWQLMSSCNDRKINDYEHLGWWQFTDAPKQSEAYKTLFVNGLTRTLVAAKAETCNTKTNGNILLQMIYDMSNPFKKNDRILNGPTNDAWLFPWLNYLKSKGVDYHFGSEAIALEEENGNISGVKIKTQDGEQTFTADYYLCALPVERAAELVKNPQILKADPDLQKIMALKESVAWMNGIQFFLKEDLPLNKGHIILADTPWALTAISQAQFWHGKITDYGNHTAQGIISVDVSNWENEGSCHKKPANTCNKKEVLEEVFIQMKNSFNTQTEVLKIENIILGFIDDSILFEEEFFTENKVLQDKSIQKLAQFGSSDMNHNEEPLLVNQTNTWAIRNTAKTAIPNFFLASDYVRTNTDLATMEGANEAARRAVNHIIDCSGEKHSYCKVWKFKAPFWLSYYQYLDKKRYAQGLDWKLHKPCFLPLLKFGMFLLRKIKL